MSSTVLVTGGDGGIGKACVGWLEERGYEVLVLDRARGHDACDGETVRTLINGAPLSAVIHGAGSVGSGGILEGTVDEWRRVLDDNLVSAMVVLQAAIPQLVDGASVVLFSSVNGRHGGNRLSGPAYAAAKAGIIGLTRNAAKELAERRIRVNALAPGPVETPMLDRLTAQELEGLRRGMPLGSITSADEIAATVGWLLSDAARSVTGAVIDINGGMWMG